VARSAGSSPGAKRESRDRNERLLVVFLEEERRILEALARGDREIQAGKGASLDSVLREADKLLDQE